MASRGYQHCANCIGTLSFPMALWLHWATSRNVHVFQKRRHTLTVVTLLILNPFSDFFTVRFSNKFVVKYLLKILPCLVCTATPPCERLMSENGRQSQTNVVINDKSQCTVVAYLRCGGFSITKLRKVYCWVWQRKKLKSVTILHSYGQKGELSCALSSTFSSVVARRTKQHQK